MNFHQVQVDNDVFEYVKMHAEPLVDDFNSALKKMLGIGQIRTPIKKSKTYTNNFRQIPLGTPQALIQILKVIQYVIRGKNRKEATRLVAKEHDVTPQTVMDKYCRQLGLTALEFESLLEEPGYVELKKLLKNKFKNFENIIDDILD